MPAPDPHAILATAACRLGATVTEPPVLRPAREEGDWYTPLAHRLPAAGHPPQAATALATALEALPEVSWATSRGAGVLFSIHTRGLAAHLHPRAGAPTSATDHPASRHHSAANPDQFADRPASRHRPAGQDWPTDLYPVAFAHARSRNLARAAAAHGVWAPADPAGEPDTAQVLSEPHARELLVHVATLVTAPEPDRLLLRGAADLFQHWYAGTRLTPRGQEPVTSYHRIRLAVNHATAAALATGLSALGLDAPEHL